MRLPPEGKRGQKVRYDIRIRSDLAQWVDEMSRQGNGRWSYVAVIEHCIEIAMQVEHGTRPDRAMNELMRLRQQVDEIALGVARLRQVESFKLEERFLPSERRPKTVEAWIAAMEEAAGE